MWITASPSEVLEHPFWLLVVPIGGFPKLGVPFWGPYTKDYSILGSKLGSPILGNYQLPTDRLHVLYCPSINLLFYLSVCRANNPGVYVLARTQEMCTGTVRICAGADRHVNVLISSCATSSIQSYRFAALNPKPWEKRSGQQKPQTLNWVAVKEL